MSLRSIYSSFTAFGPTFLGKQANKGHVPHNAGFMMIELLISLLIMSAMSSVVLSANSNMSARLQTDNLAHLIALSIREAQTRALSAVAPVGATSAGSIPGYGVYFSTAENNKVTLFTDTDLDGQYSTGDSAVLSTSPSLGQGYTINGFQNVKQTGGSFVTNPPVNAVSIFFHRPRPDAIIKYNTNTSTSIPTSDATQAEIVIRSPKSGVTKTIKVTSTGQISVQ